MNSFPRLTLNKLIHKAGTITGQSLEAFESVRDRSSLNRLLSIMDNPSHLLHSRLLRQQSYFYLTLIQPYHQKECRKSFLLFYIKLHNNSVYPQPETSRTPERRIILIVLNLSHQHPVSPVLARPLLRASCSALTYGWMGVNFTLDFTPIHTRTAGDSIAELTFLLYSFDILSMGNVHSWSIVM